MKDIARPDPPLALNPALRPLVELLARRALEKLRERRAQSAEPKPAGTEKP